MIALCFGTALRGCLRHAARPDGFVTSFDDILCIHWDFSLGDLSALPEKVREEGNRLKSWAWSGRSIRLWDNNTPFTRCGLLLAADLLGEAPCDLFVVSLPREHVREDGVVIRWRGWEEMDPQELDRFVTAARLVSPAERQTLARRWRELRRENAPLRTMEGEQVVSVPADYYDDRIRREFPREPVVAAQLIGDAMDCQRIPHGEGFIAWRIRTLIENKELRLVEEHPTMFSRSIIAPME